jgi:hypothetical protein
VIDTADLLGVHVSRLKNRRGDADLVADDADEAAALGAYEAEAAELTAAFTAGTSKRKLAALRHQRERDTSSPP